VKRRQRPYFPRGAVVWVVERTLSTMPATWAARMVASLRSTRPVAKAVLPNRIGRLGHRLSERILTMKPRLGMPLSPNVGFVLARGEMGRARADKRATVGEGG
jgi:hypothetical protein